MSIKSLLHPQGIVSFGEAAGAADWNGSIKAGDVALDVEQIEVIMVEGGRYMVRALLKVDREPKH